MDQLPTLASLLWDTGYLIFKEHNSVLLCLQMLVASLSTALLRLSPVPCPELSPHSAFQHRNNPFLILQLKLAVKLAMQSYEHVRIGHTNPLLMGSQSPKASVPKAVIVTATSLHSPSSVPGSGSAMSAAGRQRPGPGPEWRVEVVPDNC